MIKDYLYIGILLVSALLLAGCADSVGTPGEQKNPGGIETPMASDTVDRREIRATESPPAGLERVEITLPAPTTSEVPAEIMEEIIADLVERTGAVLEDIHVVKGEAVVWSDGSLGCPEPGEYYIQMMINGYRVVLEVEGVEYDYRVSDQGSFRLCDGENMPLVDSPDTENQNPLVRQAKEDLTLRPGVPNNQIEVVHIQEVTWRDGSLGCLTLRLWSTGH